MPDASFGSAGISIHGPAGAGASEVAYGVVATADGGLVVSAAIDAQAAFFRMDAQGAPASTDCAATTRLPLDASLVSPIIDGDRIVAAGVGAIDGQLAVVAVAINPTLLFASGFED